jgi:hypothetical protein
VHTVSEKLGIEPDADQDSANYRKADFTSRSRLEESYWKRNSGNLDDLNNPARSAERGWVIQYPVVR